MAEVANAQLGRPLAMVTVQQRKLKGYREGRQHQESMLDTPDEVMYPVLVKDAPRAAIYLTRVKRGGWKLSSFSDAPLIRALARAGVRERGLLCAPDSRVELRVAAAWREGGSLCRWISRSVTAKCRLRRPGLGHDNGRRVFHRDGSSRQTA